MTTYYAGVDLGATNLRTAVVDVERGAILAQRCGPTLGREGHERVIRRMVGMIREAVADSGIPTAEFKGIGVGVPGTPDSEDGTIRILPNLPGQWIGVPLRTILQEQFDRPVALINDVRAITLAEWIFGAGRGIDTLICLALGTGIGGGVVVNGKFHTGIRGTAGEFGHHVVEIDGPPCGCGGRGCLELYASGPAIAAMAVKEFMHGRRTLIGELAGYDLNRVTAETVVKAAAAGDRIAGEILQRAGTYLGIGVSNLIGTLSPQRVIFAGSVAQAGELLLAHVRKIIRERASVLPVDQIELVQAQLGAEAGMVGAALWAERCQNQQKTSPLVREDWSL